jgi:hypothetical protein
MEKVTYTKKQLMAFTVKELATIGLSSGIDFKGLKKEEIVKKMMNVQKAEKVATQAQPEIKKEPSNETVTPKPIEEVKEEVVIVPVEAVVAEEENEAPVEQVKVKRKSEEVNEAVSSEKPVFHRPIRRRNPMNFR